MSFNSVLDIDQKNVRHRGNAATIEDSSILWAAEPIKQKLKNRLQISN